jgi:hypothetical protein
MDKTCLTCNKELRGRIDKKFCDDYCRNNYNNQLNSDATNLIRNINNILRKNRRILYHLLVAKDTAKATRDQLIQKGFNFNYYTNIYTNKQGNVYHFVYDYGYMATSPEWLLIVHRKDERSS